MNEFEAFKGLNESYKQMDDELNKIAPKCHFRPMLLERGENESYNDIWWKCSVCNHVKGF